MDLDVRPLNGSLGAEVHGLRLAALTVDEWEALHAAWLEHLVLFFPGQHLSPEEHVSFAARFGNIEVHPFLPKLDADHPEVVVLDSDDGSRVDVWHTDVTFSTTPPLASILQMEIVPDFGGDTLWTNQHLAYESLSPALRSFLEGLTAVHTAEPFGHPEAQVRHPVVTVHPQTGRRILFVNRTFTAYIPELRHAESEALLQHLYAWSERPDVQCRYRWAPGTVGIWDNRCTQHYAINDFTGRRRVRRVTVLGHAPTGHGDRWDAMDDRERERTLRHIVRARPPEAEMDPTPVAHAAVPTLAQA